MKTIKMKKILIAVDYDPTAQKVAELGFSLAKAMNSEVVLLHVVTDPVYYSSIEYSPIVGYTGYEILDPLSGNTVVEIRKAAQLFLDKLKQHLNDETIKTIVVEGNFAESIIESAKSVHADIIVIGSHSHSWLSDAIMGSVTSEVLHKSTIPLFIIPTKKSN